MSYQGINTGSSPNDGTGDTLLDGGIKINSNFLEIYNLVGDGTDLFVGVVTQISAGTNVNISTSYGSVEISAPTPSQLSATNLNITGVSTLGSSNGIGTVTIGIGTTALYVDGSSRITGILTVGTDSITIDGNSSLVRVGSAVTIDGSNNVIYLGDTITMDSSSGIITSTKLIVGSQEITGSGGTMSQLYVSGISTLTGNVSLGSSLLVKDNKKIVLGNSGEFEIYHNDSDGNVIKDNIESLNILSDNVNFKSEDGATEIILLNTDSNKNVELYYAGSKKLDTRSSGVRILGGLLVQSGVTTLGVVTGATYYGDGSNLTLTGADGSGMTGVVTTLSGTDASGVTGITTLIQAGSNISVTTNSGISTISYTGVANTANINADSLVVTGVSTLGVVTDATYYGDGSNLTGIAVTSNVSTDSLVVSGVSTLGVVTATNQYNTGIVTAIGGFVSSASTQAVQINFSGNTLTFTVAGIGSTSLTLS